MATCERDKLILSYQLFCCFQYTCPNSFDNFFKTFNFPKDLIFHSITLIDLLIQLEFPQETNFINVTVPPMQLDTFEIDTLPR